MKNETLGYRNSQVQRWNAQKHYDLLVARQAAGLDLSTGLRPSEILRHAELALEVKSLWFRRETSQPADSTALQAALTAEVSKADATPAYRRKIAELQTEARERLTA